MAARATAGACVLLGLGLSVSGLADIIPPERRIDWTPGVTVGVPGGIPSRAEVGATVDAARFGSGRVDASDAISAAIDACPTGKVVFLPAGTYRLDQRVYRPGANAITLRGAGIGKTILMCHNGDQALLFGTSDWPRPSAGVAIRGAAEKGATTLSVADTAGFAVGKLARVEQDDLPYVIATRAPGKNNRLLSATFLITGKTAHTVILAPPLPFAFTNAPRLVPYQQGPLAGFGIEDLTIDGNARASTGIQFEQAWGCWVRNVEIVRVTNRQMLLVCFVGGEIRHGYTHGVIGGGPNHEGIDLFADCSHNLIEDNIAYNAGGIVLGDSQGGCAGNVIAYNFCYAEDTGSELAGAELFVSHGPHNVMNLFEGNLASGVISDGYHGSTSHGVIFRNWLTATHPGSQKNLIAVNIGRWNTCFTVVGNILGSAAFSPAGLLEPDVPFDYSTPVIYKLGFPNMGNNGLEGTWGPDDPPDYRKQASADRQMQQRDLNVKATLIRHGNYDYRTKSIAWDAAIADRTLPPSCFRTNRPAFFGNLAWPPFDPADPPGYFNDANLCRIPAGYRYVHGVDPPSTPVRGSSVRRL